MAEPDSLTPTVQGFDILDLKSLAKATTKTVERLAPFSQLQNPSSHDARPKVVKIVNKIKTYLEAIDASIQVVHAAYKMSKTAATLWNIPPYEKTTLATDADRQQRLEDLVMLADAAYEKAEKANTVFKQVEQDFYRIAASTKDIEFTVQLPVDPALPNMIKKPLKDVGSDLVANLNLLAEFSRRTSDLTAWCGWVKAGIIAIDGAVVPPQNDTSVDADLIRSKWERVHADCSIYHSMISETQSRYAAMLPLSTELWQVSMREASTKNEVKAVAKGQQLGARRNVSNLFRDAVRHLGCHACHGCFLV